MTPTRIPAFTPGHWIAAAVAIGVFVLALANTQAPAPRETYTIAAMVVWALVIGGILIGAFPRAPIPRTAAWAGGLIAGFAALTTLSIFWTSDQGNTFDEIVRASGFAGMFVLVVLASRDGEAGWWLRGLAIGLAAIAVVGLAPRFLPDLFGSPDVELEAQGRLGYPVHYWNGLGALMAGLLALLAWLSVEARTRASRAVAFAAIALPILALYLAQSRGGLLASIAAIGVLLAAGPNRQRLSLNLGLAALLLLPLIGFVRLRPAFVEEPGTDLAADQGLAVLLFFLVSVAAMFLVRRALDRRLRWVELKPGVVRAGVAAAAVIALAVFLAADPVERFDRFREPPTAEQTQSDVTAALTERSGGGRWQFWGTALDAFADAPVKGIGAGEFGVYWNRHGPFGFQVQDAHSLFLEALAELGLAGFLLIGGFFGLAAVVGALRSRYVRDGAASVALALLAAGAVSAAFDFVWELPVVFAPVILAAALLTGSATTPTLINAPPPPPVLPRRGPAGLALASVTLAFGWLTLVACGLLLLTERKLDSSRDAVSAGEFEKAIAEAQDAVDLMPFSAEPRVQLGLAFQRGGDLVSARSATLEAIDRADRDWRWWRQLGLIEIAAGNLDGACEAVRRARELNPRQALLYRRTECPDLPSRPPE